MLFLFGRSLPPSLSRYFSENAYKDGHQVEFASMGEFGDEEPFAELKFDPKGQLCVIFQSVVKAGGFNPSSHFMQMLACADNLKREGAAKVWAVNPLAGFMRQDKIRNGRRESQLSNLAPRLMKEAGVDGMSTIEAHSKEAVAHYESGLGHGNVLNINPNELFSKALARLGVRVETVVNPDNGSDVRAIDLAEKLGITNRFSIDKERSKEGISHKGHTGQVLGSTVMIDDMASSLGTARKALELIYDKGSKQNILAIAHPIMTGKAWDNLAKLIEEQKIDRVLFLPTFSRDEEFIRFKQQYGPEIAEKIVFLEDEFNAMLYDHVTQELTTHPAMQL